jgi:capsular polysaccharide biosynthesis protein
MKTYSVEQLLTHLRTRGRFLAIACGVAFVLSLGISLVMTRKYTATVSIVIDPPASSDPRAATAISPIYLESLRTYESFAEGDSLFSRAVDKFHLRSDQGQTIESLKQKILRVNKLKDSKILQLQVTLPSAQTASAVAQFIAGEVVNISHRTGAGTDTEMRQNAQQQLDQWQQRYTKAVDEYATFNAKWPVESLQGELEALQDVSSRVLRSSMEAGVDAAEYSAREKLPPAEGDDPRFIHQEAAARATRAAVLQRQATDLQNLSAAKGVELSKRMATRSHLEAEMKMAQAGLEAEGKHFRELQDAAGGRGDVLTIVDPGIVPERPSSPNVVLNVLVSTFIAFVLSSTYVLAGIGRSSQ